jgi:hypothetical protein
VLARVVGGLIAALASACVATAALGRQPGVTQHIRDHGFPTHTFYSDNSIHPPLVWVSGTDPDPVTSGDIFLDAQNSTQAGPMILDPQGKLIWFEPVPHGFAHDLAVQSYQGQTVLTYWQSTGGGQGVILNHYYQPIATVHAGGGHTTGDHEFQLTPQGTALLFANFNPPADLRPVGGPRGGSVADDIIQEVGIPAGNVLWQWDPFQHVHLTASYAGKPGSGAYDYLHVNSIQQLPNGNLLVSARNTWAVYEVSKQTGVILWTLGGKHSSFKMGPGTSFAWQHDARMQPDGTITLFDDGSDGLMENETASRALRIRLDYKRHTATLVHAYTNTPSILSFGQGNMQVLADGNTFVGFGSTPYFAEFDRRGREMFSGHFGAPLQSYRAYRFQWWGQPATPPSIAVSGSSNGAAVHASWNGATNVASWQVLAGATQTALGAVGQFPRTAFETAMQVPSTGPCFAVQALDSNGQLLGTSPTAGC